MNTPETETETSARTLDLEMIDAVIPVERRGTTVRLEKVNWKVAHGDYWFVGGLHRSGKTDLMSVAAGITPPLGGQIRLFGSDPAAARPGEVVSERLRVGLVFDGGRLLNHLSVVENIALPVAYHRNLPLEAAIEIINPLLDLVELQAWRDFPPSRISRNWQQRAGLARALALRPELLLVDNPLSGLDPQDTRWWLSMLRQLSTGHPVLDGRPLTIVVAGDTLLPWRDQARQFAVLRGKQLHVLPGAPGPDAVKDPLLEELMPAGLSQT